MSRARPRGRSPPGHPRRRHLGPLRRCSCGARDSQPCTSCHAHCPATLRAGAHFQARPTLGFTGCDIRKTPRALVLRAEGRILASESAPDPLWYRSPRGADTRALQSQRDAPSFHPPCSPSSAGGKPSRALKSRELFLRLFFFLSQRRRKRCCPHICVLLDGAPHGELRLAERCSRCRPCSWLSRAR